MARVTMTISLPEVLRKRMKEYDFINWSAVCQKAFEAKIKQAEQLKE